MMSATRVNEFRIKSNVAIESVPAIKNGQGRRISKGRILTKAFFSFSRMNSMAVINKRRNKPAPNTHTRICENVLNTTISADYNGNIGKFMDTIS